MPVKPTAFKPEFYDFAHLAESDDTYRATAAAELLDVLAERAVRNQEGLRLYEPLPEQDRFHRSRVHTRLYRGGNRSGKTTCCAVEVARAVTGRDPYRKFPNQGTVYVVGRDWEHIGEVIYPKLFLSEKEDPFFILKDRKTRQWRCYRPWEADDFARREEAKPAGPLVPERYVDGVSWYRQNEKIPAQVTLTTGWKIVFFTGKGLPPRGQNAHLVWLDEEIEREEWYSEMVARTAAVNGFILWSATPQNGTDQFLELMHLAERQEHDPDKTVEEFHVRLSDNRHVDKRASELIVRNLSDEDRQVRVAGESVLARRKIYYEYERHVHGIRRFTIPNTWTNYAVIDPGHIYCAVLFAAVPDPADVPRDEWELLLWGELYLHRSSAERFGQEMARACEGRSFHAFIIDKHGSMPTEAGSGKSIYRQYSEALKRHRVESETTGSEFAWGCDDRKGGIEAFRSYLRVRPNGHPRVRVFVEEDANGNLSPLLPNWEWELARYRSKIDPKTKEVLDEPDERGRTHLMACTRYLASHPLKFVPPSTRRTRVDPAIQRILSGQRRGPGRTLYFGPAHAGVG